MAEPEPQPAEDPSVGDSIRAAITELTPAEEPEAPPAEPEDEPREAPEAEAGDDAPDEAAEAPEGTPEGEAEAAEEAPEAEQEPEEVILAPASWSKEDREIFAKLGGLEGEAAEVAKAAAQVIARREKQRDDATKQARGELAPLRAVVDEYRDYFRQIGVTPDQSFRTLVAAERSLRFGTPSQKADALKQIARDYGIEVAAGPAGNGQTEESAFTDPELTQLEGRFDGRLGKIEELLTSRQQEDVKAKEIAAKQTAASFFDELQDLDPVGSPEARYVAEVMPRFQEMVEADRRKHGTPDVARLKDLLKDAAWSEPGVRAKMQEDIAARQRAEAKPVKKTIRKVSSSASGGTGAGAHSEEPDLSESVRDSIERSRAQLERAGGSLR